MEIKIGQIYKFGENIIEIKEFDYSDPFYVNIKVLVNQKSYCEYTENEIESYIRKKSWILQENFRESKNQYFLKIAGLTASRSTCPRRSVGCVIVNKHGHIKATGYNGVPRNYPHCNENPCGGQDKKSSEGLNSCMATHAEQNALLQCDNVMEIETIYVTTSPCITCAKLIANTGCKTVIYAEEYSDRSGIEMLKKLNIITIHERIND